ncbi:Cysteine-rich motor neuron 1 protein [Holothuria leucospilota]|uniref:Cysteine-rich motor neuron 1 protein n=1 Tax=Holothuria leucospilota TaxID=206669 RepID=A0A9Q0YDZ0_HOLLE|nr:Cysteine-rich motor neuron 1 protein [Holothuria leucospilota]
MLCVFILLAVIATSICQPQEIGYDYSYYQYSISFENRKPCFYMGEIFFHGSTWKPLPCAECRCLDGNSHCQFHTCPEIECQGELKRRARKCCPTCHGKVISKTSVDYCFWRGITYEHGESFTLNPCTDCKCTKGKGSCVVRSCPPLPCSDPVIDEKKCCPECP